MKFIVADRPAWMKKRGILGFQDNTPGSVGSGVPSYVSTPGYQASPQPRVVGARWFCGDACGTHGNLLDRTIDHGPPDVLGNFYAAPKEAYQKAVEAHHVDADDSDHKRLLQGKGAN